MFQSDKENNQADIGSTNLRMNTKQAANYLGVSASYLEKRRLDGDGPEYLKIGRRVIYEKLSLDKFSEKCKRQSR